MKSVLQFVGGAAGWIVAQTGLLGILPHGAQVAVQGVATVLGVLGIRNAAQASPSVVSWLDSKGKGWKTVTGVGVALLGALLAPDVLGVLPQGLAHGLTVVGTVLGALGLYHAQAKR